LLDAARFGRISLFTSPALLVELDDVLGRDPLARRLAMAAVDRKDLVQGYASLAVPIAPVAEIPSLPDDPDDAIVLATAEAAKADVIISGDRHLLDVRLYKGIRILSAAEVLALIGA
jgi:putative PIN family toxin of toxin-antitoxin system